ncbi:mechanosensitive ion channel protein 10-like isoform X1 [Silene latifolia]|uniref:mechanosensitive ion channel protein 10-like isoform X1 n=1 Tax=Silene latifolia TaxID=37657 RepID=UPI003D771529
METLVSASEQPQTLPPQNTDTHSVSVKVETLVSATEQSNEVQNLLQVIVSSIQNNRNSHLPCYLKILELFLYLLYCLFVFVCLVPVVLLIYVCVTVVTVLALAFFLVEIVVIRFLQFFVESNNFGKVVMNKTKMRIWVSMDLILLLFEVGLFYPFAKHVPGLKLVMIIGLPITNWFKIIALLIVLYILSQLVWVCIESFSGWQASDSWIYKSDLINPEATSEIFGCLLFWLAEVEVMNRVPAFKQSKIIGIYTRKWVEACIFILIGYNIITCLSQMFVCLLLRFDRDDSRLGKILRSVLSCLFLESLEKGASNRRYTAYIASGIKRSIIFLLTMVMLLLTWVLYFGRHLNVTSQDKRIMEFGTRTLVSVLICSFLWLIKSCILLYWEAHTVYDRLHSKFTDIGKLLYFLILLSYTHFQSVVEQPVTPPSTMALLTKDCDGGIPQKLKRKCGRDELINRTGPNASAYQLSEAAQDFFTAKYALLKEGIFDDLHHLQSYDSGDNNENIVERLEKIVKCGEYAEDDWKMFSELLSTVDSTNEITFQKVKIWMERSHSRCKFLANTLQSEKEAAKCLNRILSGLIIAATVLMWLFLTGFATTQVIVLITSPLLAATFVFGDTAKGLFQGLIFVYVVHPFNVGDLCVIDEKLLEVKRIGVWCTTFSKVRTVSTQQEIIYPNSGLATKNVINHKTDFDWTDYMELSLSSTDEEATKNLKHQIETYLETEKEKFTPNYHSVEILEIGDKDKIAVHFRHNVQAEGWIYFECLKEKEKRKSEFSLHLRNLLNQPEFKTKTQI